MKIGHCRISAETLKGLGLEKGTNVVKLSLILTDLSFFNKLYFAFGHNRVDKAERGIINEILNICEREILLIITHHLIGKFYEFWNTISGNTSMNRDCLQNLGEPGITHYKDLKNYLYKRDEIYSDEDFDGTNLDYLNSIRNEFAYHYDDNLKKFFEGEEGEVNFPDIEILSNLKNPGLTFFGDNYSKLIDGGFTKKRDKEYKRISHFKIEKSQEIIKSILPISLALILDMINHITGEEFKRDEEIEIPDPKPEDTIISNYFWEVPWLKKSWEDYLKSEKEEDSE